MSADPTEYLFFLKFPINKCIYIYDSLKCQITIKIKKKMISKSILWNVKVRYINSKERSIKVNVSQV